MILAGIARLIHWLFWGQALSSPGTQGIDNTPDITLANLALLRRAGRLQLAEDFLAKLLQAGEQGSVLHLEAARVFLLVGNVPAAAKAFNLASAEGLPSQVDWGLFARIGISLGQVPDTLRDEPVLPAWTREFFETGVDPAKEAVLLRLEDVRRETWYPLYEFLVECTGCAWRFLLPARLSLAANLEGLCPVCFGRFCLPHDRVRTYLESQVDSSWIERADVASVLFRERIADFEGEGKDLPAIMSGLSQDLIFHLSTRIWDRRTDK